jgi:hypothetical protein
VGPEAGDNARVQRGGTAGRRGRRDARVTRARTRSAAEARADDERLLARVTECKRRAGVHLSLLPEVLFTARYVHVNALRDKRRTLRR